MSFEVRLYFTSCMKNRIEDRLRYLKKPTELVYIK